ncbi:hypothetical protein C0Q70_01603 [Pomacea canaliculata]|uniref:Uncharacterized protein n=1 Tax=Pomacea canaliculata TaxID=400727 RepID=A0A2T7PZY4_POMCA|nr:hypothetical protein C0Q70_01603 [Pomacea canaliculata]
MTKGGVNNYCLSNPGSSSGREERNNQRLNLIHVMNAMEKLHNEVAFSVNAIHHLLRLEVGTYSIHQISSALQRGIDKGRIRETPDGRLFKQIIRTGTEASLDNNSPGG